MRTQLQEQQNMSDEAKQTAADLELLLSKNQSLEKENKLLQSEVKAAKEENKDASETLEQKAAIADIKVLSSWLRFSLTIVLSQLFCAGCR